MGVEKNKEIMQRYFDELMNNSDYSKADEILHEDFSGAAGGEIKGIEAHKLYNQGMHTAIPDLFIDVQEIIADENKAAVFSLWNGTHNTVIQGFPPTGKKFSFDMASIYEFKDGKVIRGIPRVVSDNLGLYQQVGVLPSNEEILKAYKESHNLE